jgi:hypothetical protein
LDRKKQLFHEILESLFDGTLKPLHSRNARKIFEVFYQFQRYNYITTYDLEIELKKNDLQINKKEINGWLISLQEAQLIIKLDERGKPVVSSYKDRYTFDLWRLSETGLIVGQRLPIFMEKKDMTLPSLTELTPSKIHELEDLYFMAKLLITLYSRGGSLSYTNLRKELSIDREKLAIYSWPDASYSEKPLFEVIVKPPSLRAKVFKVFGWVLEQDLSFKLTEEGLKIAFDIESKDRIVES